MQRSFIHDWIEVGNFYFKKANKLKKFLVCHPQKLVFTSHSLDMGA